MYKYSIWDYRKDQKKTTYTYTNTHTHTDSQHSRVFQRFEQCSKPPEDLRCCISTSKLMTATIYDY